MTSRPRPVTTDQRFLAELCDLLELQNDLLRGLNARIPASAGPGVQVEAPVGAPAGGDGGAVELNEPAVPPTTPNVVPLAEPAPPVKARRQPASKTTTPRRRTPKED